MGKVYLFRRHARSGKRQSSRSSASRGLGPILWAVPLAVFTAVFFTDGPPQVLALSAAPSAVVDRESAYFTRCGLGERVSCVVDGDTFWYRGAKIRIADINAPEVSSPECTHEAQLGARATRRLLALLNEDRFTLESADRDRDDYGRLLRTVTRDGASLGEALVEEGIAEHWQGYRRSWC